MFPYYNVRTHARVHYIYKDVYMGNVLQLICKYIYDNSVEGILVERQVSPFLEEKQTLISLFFTFIHRR